MLSLSSIRHRLRRHHHRHLLPLLRSHLHSLDLTHPTFMIYASNTAVGKTLVSAGIANSVLSSPSFSFLYLKPVQTGFPRDSDARFVYRKVSDLFRRRSAASPQSALFASNHAIRASIPAREEVIGFGPAEGEEGEFGERGLCSYEEVRVGGAAKCESVRFRLDCKTIFGWKAAISPHLAVEREGMEVDDSTLRGMVAKCLDSWSEDGGDWRKEGAWRVIETAGGVASPGPSGTLQCDLYRCVFCSIL